jgi:hypothetical protein
MTRIEILAELREIESQLTEEERKESIKNSKRIKFKFLFFKYLTINLTFISIMLFLTTIFSYNYFGLNLLFIAVPLIFSCSYLKEKTKEYHEYFKINTMTDEEKVDFLEQAYEFMEMTKYLSDEESFEVLKEIRK